MNILYLSHLTGASYAGPTYSVPEQIAAQSKIDNVLWYNAVSKSPKKWKDISYYYDLSDYPLESIYALPEPFNQPDIVIVELFYNMVKSRMLRELLKGSIPYIIIPRGELTAQAQRRKRWKKLVANLLVCRNYARRASAIQYLTEQEYQCSGNKWNKNAIVIPNGISIPQKAKEKFCEDGRIKCVLIGRLEPFQKGLDMFIEACSIIKDKLTTEDCVIDFYGPDVDGKKDDLELMIEDKGLTNFIRIHDAVYGEDKEKVLLSHDVFVIPSRFEGHPMALIEAMAYGLPCVVTTGANMREEVEVSGAGWGCENSVRDLTDAMAKMLESKQEFEQRGINAKILAMEYQWDNIAIKSSEIYKSMIGGC